MEASQAAVGGDAGQQGQAQQGEQAQASPDLSTLAEQFGRMEAGQEEMRQFLMSQPWQQPQEQAEPEQEQADEIDLSFLDPDVPGYDPQHVEQRFGDLIGQVAERRAQQLLQQQVEPLRQDVQNMRREQELAQLVDEFPEIGEEQTARQVMDRVRALAEANGHPELAHEPWLIRMTYLAGRAIDVANQEGASEPSAAHLEGGGGAGPAAPQVDPGDLIVQAARGGSSVLPFH